MEKQSEGSKHMKRVMAAINDYRAKKRALERFKKSVRRLINAFPKRERPLYDEKLNDIKNEINTK